MGTPQNSRSDDDLDTFLLHHLAEVRPPDSHAHVVDPLVLRDLETLVARAIARHDGTELRAFITRRTVVSARSDDARAVWLDRFELSAVLRQVIHALKHSAVAERAEVRELLEAARSTSMAPRDVSEAAFGRLVSRAEMLDRLLTSLPMPEVIMRQVGLIASALESLDRFDFCSKHHPRDESDDDLTHDVPDDRLVRDCLACVVVPECRGSVTYGVDRSFLESAEIFPRPKDATSVEAWELFCRWPGLASPPRVAEGKDIIAAAQRVIQRGDEIEADRALDPRLRACFLKSLESYLGWLRFAVENRYAVVEWVMGP
jgi:hypothetical protein